MIPQEEKKYLCPEHKQTLVERNGKYGTFYGCPLYPDCTYVYKERRGQPNNAMVEELKAIRALMHDLVELVRSRSSK